MPLAPELSICTAPDLVAVWQRTEEPPSDGGPHRTEPPFWAVPWAGGQALARYVLDHPDVVRGRSVLDLACGSGLVGIAAARAGAAVVTAVDLDPLALAAVAMNAGHNGVVVGTSLADILDGSPLPVADVVLAGDVFYHRDLTAGVLPLLRAAAAAGCVVLVGDPRRRYLPSTGLDLVAEYDVPVPVDLEGMPVRHTTVFAVLP